MRSGRRDAVCSGGRYDGLFAQLGANRRPRSDGRWGRSVVVALMAQVQNSTAPAPPHIFLVVVGERAESAGLRLAEQLRDAHPGLRIHTNVGGGNFKAQFPAGGPERCDRLRSSSVRTKCSTASWP